MVEEHHKHGWLEDPLGPGEQYEPRFTEHDITAVRESRRKLGPDLSYLGYILPNPNDLPDTATICAVHEDLTRAAALGKFAVVKDLPLISSRANDAFIRAEVLLGALRELRAVQQDITANTWVRRFYEAWLFEGADREDLLLFDSALPLSRGHGGS